MCDIDFIEGRPFSSVLGVDADAIIWVGVVQRQLDRMYDHFDLYSCGTENPLEHLATVSLIRFYMLNEVLAFALSGLAKVEIDSKGFSLSRYDDDVLRILQRLWFSNFVSGASSQASMAWTKVIADVRQVNIGHDHPLISFLIDKEFAISWAGLDREGKVLKTIQHLRQLMHLVATLQIVKFRNETIQVNCNNLLQYGLDYSFVSEVLARQSQSRVIDRFLTRYCDRLELHVDSMSSGLRNYIYKLADEYGEVDKLREHVGGMFFEKKTVQNRLSTDPAYKPRYVVFDGFDRYQVSEDKENKVDVDFILHDKLLNHYYFIQVKHGLLGEPAYYENVIKRLQNDIDDGLEQIREARRLMNAGMLSRVLAVRGINGVKQSNSSFILLHNFATYDYQVTSDGIALYEWASFRNLLLDCQVICGQVGEAPKTAKLQTEVCLNDPDNLLKILFRDHPVYKEVRQQAWAVEHVAINLHVNDVRVRVEGLSI